MATIIGLKELRQNATEIAARVQKGEHFTVVKRSKPAFDIVPSASQAFSDVEATKQWTEKLVKKHQKAFDSLSQK